MSSSYSNKEISEWNSADLTNWLIDNKYRGISELCQKYSLSGYDLFFITDDILKNELGLTSFHERIVTQKLIYKLTSEHLKLNIINSNGDNVILTLDNNHNMSLGDISQYVGNMFDIEPNFILYKDYTKQEVLSPSLKIIQLMILYPRIYKTLNISNMKDYHQIDDKTTNIENNEGANSLSKTGDTISHTADKNEENFGVNSKYKNKNNIPLTNNVTYSFGDNSRDLNNNSLSNTNNNFTLNNKNKYYQDMSPMDYKPNSDISNVNQNKLMINNNTNMNNMNNNNSNNNQINENITPSNMINNRKYKTEKRVYRDKEDFYYNYNNNNNMQNNPTDFMNNKERNERNKGIMSTSSNDEMEDNGEEEMKFTKRKYQESNDMDEDLRNNNYDIRKNNNMYKRKNDNNNNYYENNEYNDENEDNNNMDNNRRMKMKRGYNDNKLYKGNIIYNENFNDSNQVSNNYYKN